MKEIEKTSASESSLDETLSIAQASLIPFEQRRENEFTGFLMWQVTSLWQRLMASVLRPYGLTPVQFALLAGLHWLLHREKWVTQSRLARKTKLDMMMTSQVLRTLAARGLLERRPHPTDTRAKILALTPKGLELLTCSAADIDRSDIEFFKRVDPDLQCLNDVLRKLSMSEDDDRTLD